MEFIGFKEILKVSVGNDSTGKDLKKKKKLKKIEKKTAFQLV